MSRTKKSSTAASTAAVAVVEVSKEDQRQAGMDQIVAGMEGATVSAKIRALDAGGYTRSEIAKKLNKRYQHVRNVLVTPLTSAKAAVEAEAATKS